MSAATKMVFNTQDIGKLDLGLSRKDLERFTWEQITKLKGFNRIKFLSSCNQAGVQAWVRADPEVLTKFNRERRGLKGQEVHRPLEFWSEGDVSYIDGTWQMMKMGRAVALWLASKEDITLGAMSMKTVQMDDGHGGKMYVEQPVPAVEGLLEFKAQSEHPGILAVATS